MRDLTYFSECSKGTSESFLFPSKSSRLNIAHRNLGALNKIIGQKLQNKFQTEHFSGIGIVVGMFREAENIKVIFKRI